MSTEKISLTPHELSTKCYLVTKYVASWIVERKRIYGIDGYQIQDLENVLLKYQLKDELVLIKILREKIADHNSKIKSLKSKIDGICYTDKWHKSSMLNNREIDSTLIEKLIKDNPLLDCYDIYKLYQEHC